MTDQNIVIVPEGIEGEKVGIQLHWRLAGEVEQEALHTVLKDLNLPKDCMPAPPGDKTVLKRALNSLRSGNRQLVRALGNKASGFSLVQEDADALDLEDVQDDDPYSLSPIATEERKSHEVKLTAKVIKNGDSSTLNITPIDHPLAGLLRSEFDRQRGLYVCSHDLSVWLTQKIVPHCDGVSARERGGFYYIPAGEGVKRFNRIADAISNVTIVSGAYNRLVTGIKFYKASALKEADVVEAMIDALIDETDKVCDEVADRIDDHHSGKKVFRDKGLKKTQTKAKELSTKLSLYEKLLGTSLTDMKERAEELTSAIVVAELNLIPKL